MFHCVAWK